MNATLKLRGALFAAVDPLSRSQKQLFLLLVDLACAPAALLFAVAIIHNSFLPTAHLMPMLPVMPVIVVLAGALSFVTGIYRIQLKAFEARGILKAALMAGLLALGFAVTVRAMDLPWPGAGVVIFGMLFFMLTVGARLAMLQALLWVLRLGKPCHRVLIYGAGNTGVQLVAALRSHDTIVPVAFVDDNTSLHGLTVSGLPVVHPERIGKVARDRDIERVLLAMPSASQPRQAQIARALQQAGMKVMTVPSFAQLVGTEKLADVLAPVVPGRFLNRKHVEAVLPAGAEAYMNRSVLVSGAGGSVGSELCRQLLAARPKRIVLFEVSEIALYTIERELCDMAVDLPVEIVPVLGSVTDARMARMVIADHDIEVVFHAAAYKHVPLVEANPIAGLANNVLGTRTLADAANEAGVARFILISTDKAVRPTNIMGASKRLAELVIQDIAKRSRGTVFSMVRFGNVLGSSGSVIPLFRQQIAQGGPVTLTHEDVTRYFMTIAEAARLVMLAGSFAGEECGGEVFVLDMGKPVKIRDLAQQMIEAAGYTVRSADNPGGDIEISVTGLRPGEKLHEELLIGEGLLTTPHSKILRAREASLTELQMASALRSLRSAVAVGDADAARAVVFSFVEGYRPPAGTIPPTCQPAILQSV